MDKAGEVFVSFPVMWAPGLGDELENWEKWLRGEEFIENSSAAPKLEYTDPLFRRRLSQISKMTIHVVHLLLEKYNFDKETKIVFVSFRGEIARELSVNMEIAAEHIVLPAGFSLSVFNTPVALAAIAFGLTGGYSAVYPSKQDFSSALKTAVAPVLCGDEKKIVFVYADELVPECYGETGTPLAFAAVISSEKMAGFVKLNDFIDEKIPEAFLKRLVEAGGRNV